MEDPAITQAKVLWAEKKAAAAMNLLATRITELTSAQAPAPARRRGWLLPFVAGGIIALLLTVVGTQAYNAFTAADPNPVQDWWTDAEPLVNEFRITDLNNRDTLRAGIGDVVRELEDIQNQYDALESPDDYDAQKLDMEVYLAMVDTITWYTNFLNEGTTFDSDYMDSRWIRLQGNLHDHGVEWQLTQ